MLRPILWAWRRRAFSVATLLAAAFAITAISATGGLTRKKSTEDAVMPPGAHSIAEGEDAEEGPNVLLERNAYFTSLRTAGDNQLDTVQAGRLRANAAKVTVQRKQFSAKVSSSAPITFDAAWTGLGPRPIQEVTRGSGSLIPMNGRIGALAIRSDGTFILGGAQGGIWLFDGAAWTPKTDNQPSLAIGALALAPSDDSIVYAGTGEGALSGDSMFGNGILKSTDGGQTWNHVSGDYFEGVSISRVVVDPTDPDHLYAAVLRGRGGARRTTPAEHSRYGIWESKDGAATWTLLKGTTNQFNGATDIEMDPLDPNTLWASFWSDAIYKSTDGGQTWAPAVNFGLPSPDFAAAQTRFSIAVSHPSAANAPVLYTGFDWVDANGYHKARVWKSTDGAASWNLLPAGTSPDIVEDYCGGQCFYDNVIEVDPTNPDVVYAAGQFDYGIGSGGVYRSDNGGQTWINLGWDQHPDWHAWAFDPTDPNKILGGNDGGVWYSEDRGGRTSPTDPLEAADWIDLNTGNLQIAQFTSIATVPFVPAGADSERYWGGTQDNGTLRKSVNSKNWFDVAGGDGGQVIVDQSEPDQPCEDFGTGSFLVGGCYVYGEFFGISPYRYTDGGLFFFSNAFITGGLDLTDRSEFYVPQTLNQNNPNQMFTGTYRMYRTDNVKAPAAGDVHWNTISGDLTSGCAGTAPNGARGCVISAIGVGGGEAVYVGTLDGHLWMAPDGQTSSSPDWQRQDKANGLPNRPIAWVAVDRSNYRTAWVAYNGFNAATPSKPGHVWKTSDGGKHWKKATGDLPDTPVNSLSLDPSYPDVVYAATDVGPYVTYNGGKNWSPLGTAFPMVAVWQMDFDASRRIIAAGTHGRGAFRLADQTSPVPALVLTKVDSGIPVGKGSQLDYTLTLQNIGSADATGVTVTDPLPRRTSFVSADNGGTSSGGAAVWSGLTVPMGGSITLHLTVSIAAAKNAKVKEIVNDGVTVTSAEGPGTTGSPEITELAPPYAVAIAPASLTDGARAGSAATYIVHVQNLGFTSDSYTMSSSGGTWTVSFFDSSCTTPLTTTPTVAPGASTDVCVKVDVPGGAADGDTNTATVRATSVGSPSQSATATLKTIAVTKDWLLVDQDGNAPDVQSYYTAALDANGISYSIWDLAADKNLPQGYLTAHKNVVWFTGNTYPFPLGAYESELKALLDGGGNLFLNGQDILDQAAGTTPFVHDYLHVDWDGSEQQNDISTETVTSVDGNPVTDGIGTVPLDTSILDSEFMDQITPIAPAEPAFLDDGSATKPPDTGPQPNALTFDDGYKVVFLAFPFEEYGNATQKADLVGRVETFFGS